MLVVTNRIGNDKYIMSYSYGDKCRCGHRESRHELVKASINILDNLIGIEKTQRLILDMSISDDTNCKICECKRFQMTN